MSHPENDKIIDNIRDHETKILDGLDRLQYLIEVADVWSTRGLSLKESYEKIDQLKIKFAITGD